MKVVLTEEALRNLEEIRSYLVAHYPTVLVKVEEQIRAIFRRLEEWPEALRLSWIVLEFERCRSFAIPTLFFTASWIRRLKSYISITLRDGIHGMRIERARRIEKSARAQYRAG